MGLGALHRCLSEPAGAGARFARGAWGHLAEPCGVQRACLVWPPEGRGGPDNRLLFPSQRRPRTLPASPSSGSASGWTIRTSTASVGFSRVWPLTPGLGQALAFFGCGLLLSQLSHLQPGGPRPPAHFLRSPHYRQGTSCATTAWACCSMTPHASSCTTTVTACSTSSVTARSPTSR